MRGIPNIAPARRWATAAGLALALAGPSAFAAPPAAGSAQAAFQAGSKALEARQYPAAVKALSRAVALDPARADAWANLGLAYAGLDDHAAAAKAQQQYVRLQPDNPEGHSLLSAMLLLSHQPAQALQEEAAALRLKPDEPRYYQGLAEAYFELGQTEQEAAALERAVRLAPKEPEFLHDLGEAYVILDHIPQAQRVYAALKPLDAGKAEELRKSIADNLRRRAESLAQDKSTGALGTEPATAEAAADRGWELFDQHRYKDAAALFRKAIALDAAYPTGYAGLGAVGVQLDLYGDSEPILAKALSLKPDYSEAIYYQGLIFASQHRTSEARALLSKLRALEPARAKLLEGALAIMTQGDKQP